MAKTGSNKRSAELDVYAVLLITAALLLGTAVGITAMRNSELSKVGASGGGPLDLVGSR